MMKTTILRFAFATIALGIVPTFVSADVVIDWNATLREVMQTDGTHPVHSANPGWSTRSIAMMNTAIYDAFQAVDRTHTPYHYGALAPANTSVEAAANEAAKTLLLQCYPGESAIINAAYNARMAVIGDGTAKTNGITLGQDIANRLTLQRTGDHSGDSVPYTPGTNPGEWRPQPGQTVWGPGWGTVHTWGIPGTQSFIDALTPIPAMTSPDYTAAYNQVVAYGGEAPGSRTLDMTAIGLFWAYDRPTMGPPPVLYVKNLEEIAAAVGTSSADNARLFAMASVAMADAATAAWDGKFEDNFWRPIAGIQEGDTDGNPATIGIPGWKPLGAPGNNPGGTTDDFTPPFPAWPSGHATMGAAVFKTLELFFGTNDFADADTAFGIDTETATYALNSAEAGGGDTRTFHSFTQAGPIAPGMEDSPEGENAMSRVYLGVHWIFDQTAGTQLGHDIATYVAGNRFQAVPEPSTSALAGISILAAGCVARRRRQRRAA